MCAGAEHAQPLRSGRPVGRLCAAGNRGQWAHGPARSAAEGPCVASRQRLGLLHGLGAAADPPLGPPCSRVRLQPSHEQKQSALDQLGPCFLSSPGLVCCVEDVKGCAAELAPHLVTAGCLPQAAVHGHRSFCSDFCPGGCIRCLCAGTQCTDFKAVIAQAQLQQRLPGRTLAPHPEIQTCRTSCKVPRGWSWCAWQPTTTKLQCLARPPR